MKLDHVTMFCSWIPNRCKIEWKYYFIWINNETDKTTLILFYTTNSAHWNATLFIFYFHIIRRTPSTLGFERVPQFSCRKCWAIHTKLPSWLIVLCRFFLYIILYKRHSSAWWRVLLQVLTGLNFAQISASRPFSSHIVSFMLKINRVKLCVELLLQLLLILPYFSLALDFKAMREFI